MESVNLELFLNNGLTVLGPLQYLNGGVIEVLGPPQCLNGGVIDGIYILYILQASLRESHLEDKMWKSSRVSKRALWSVRAACKSSINLLSCVVRVAVVAFSTVTPAVCVRSYLEYNVFIVGPPL